MPLTAKRSPCASTSSRPSACTKSSVVVAAKLLPANRTAPSASKQQSARPKRRRKRASRASDVEVSVGRMPLFEALILVASIAVLVIATQSRRLHPFLALVVVATAFGLVCGFSVSQIGKTFGNGFGQAAYTPG